MQDRSVLTGIQMSPSAFRLVVVDPTYPSTIGASPLALLMLQMDVNLAGFQLQLHMVHSPRGFDSQYSSVEFAVLHTRDFRTDFPLGPLASPTRNPEYPLLKGINIFA